MKFMKCWRGMGCVVAGVICSVSAAAQVAIVEGTSFHPPVADGQYEENWSEDTGGLLVFFVENAGPQSDAVALVTVNGVPVDTIEGVKWWRVWPESMAAPETGNPVCAVTVKSVSGPLAAGQEVLLGVQTQRGFTASQTFLCESPGLRIASVLPKPGMQRVNVYLRNDGTQTARIGELWINETAHVPGDGPYGAKMVGGVPDIAPGAVGILQVAFPEPLPVLHPAALRVRHLVGGHPKWVGAAVRLFPAEFVLGTWSTDWRDTPPAGEFARDMRIDFNLPGGTTTASRVLWDQYFTGHTATRNGNPTAITRNRNNPGLAAWFVKDEPETSPSENPSALMQSHNRDYWVHGSPRPTYMNLCTSRAFQEYGPVTDIAGMDHYAMYSAFTALPGTWLTRVSRMEEALDYTDLLRRNTEPQRMWNWAQLGGSMWGTQPQPWGVSYQFWAHVMGGSKGVLWFVYTVGRENNPAYRPQLDAAEAATRQFAQVRELCLYGEPLDNVTHDPGLPVIARSLVSERENVVVALNNNYEMTGILPLLPEYVRGGAHGEITVDVPAWVPLESVLRVTPDGSEPAAFTRSGRLVTIPLSLGPDETGVFVIGGPDTQAPQAPEAVVLTNAAADGGVTLSWKEARDDRGVWKYRVYRDDAPVDEVAGLLWRADVSAVPHARYRVAAVDAAGNVGEASEPVRFLEYGFNRPGHDEGWWPNPDGGSVIPYAQVTDGAFHLTLDGASPTLQSPVVRVDTTARRWFRMRLDVPPPVGQARLQWVTESDTGWDAAKSAVIPLPGKASGFQTVEADLGALAAWAGVVTRVRLVFGEGAQSGPLSLDLAQFALESVLEDADGDGLTSLQELDVYGTDPYNRDTDGDGLTDGAEVLTHGTDPLTVDTDGDGFDDGREVASGTDPNDPEDYPRLPLGGGVPTVTLLLLAVTGAGALRGRRRVSGPVQL